MSKELLKKAQRWIPLLVAACVAVIFNAPAVSAQAEPNRQCAKQGAYVRSGPGTDNTIVNGLKAGEAVVVVDEEEDDDGTTWYLHVKGWTAAWLIGPCETGQGGSKTDPAKKPAESNGWAISWFSGATPQMRGQGELPWAPFPVLDPAGWPNFPDQANPAKDFPAEWSLMYEEDETQFCGVNHDGCSVVVPAGHYMLITGSWKLEGLGECHGGDGNGCAVSITNVGEESAEFTGILDNVFIVWGRYNHGDHLPEAISGLMSHASWNMTHGNSKLNPPSSTNAGSNCSVKKGCNGVNNQFFVTSGGEVLIHGETNYNRP